MEKSIIQPIQRQLSKAAFAAPIERLRVMQHLNVPLVWLVVSV